MRVKNCINEQRGALGPPLQFGEVLVISILQGPTVLYLLKQPPKANCAQDTYHLSRL